MEEDARDLEQNDPTKTIPADPNSVSGGVTATNINAVTTPVKKTTLTNLSLQPKGPVTPESSPTKPTEQKPTPSPSIRDYKLLYIEVKRRLQEQTDVNDRNISKLKDKYDALALKYEQEMESYKLDYSERELNLVKKLTKMKDEAESVKANYESIISAKDDSIKEREEELLSLKSKMEEQDHCSSSTRSTHQIIKMNNEDVFFLKPKKNKGSSKTLTCESENCENENIDLVKCNLCGKKVCEDCGEVTISKLKPVMNKCGNIYFACKVCDLLLRDQTLNVHDELNAKLVKLEKDLISSCEEKEGLKKAADATVRIREAYDKLDDENKTMGKKITEMQNILTTKAREQSQANGDNKNLKQQLETLTSHQDSLRQLLEERENTIHENEVKLNAMDSTPVRNDVTVFNDLQDTINKRFDLIDKNIDALIEKKLARNPSGHPHGTQSQAPENEVPSYAAAATPTTPQAIATAFKTSRNAEIVEEHERQKRANNMIIYGISEERASATVSLQDQDIEFITRFLETIEVEDVDPKQIVRLGKASTDRKRPLKVIMANAEDKQKIMSKLNKLRNADETFRSISVRDDYTIEERELIKTFVDEAKHKNEAHNTTSWKVRGTPKNGLRLVQITSRR